MASKTIVITGAGSGMGKAASERLSAEGHRVIGVDLRNAEVSADLGTGAGVDAMVAAVEQRAPDGIDALIAAAGLSVPHPAPTIVAVNYFGAVASFERLRPLLAMRKCARAVAIGSTSALLPTDAAIVDACLTGNRDRAVSEATARPETAYMSSKLALTLWLRRAAASPEWAGSGILLNGVAPGVVRTAMTAPLLNDPAMIDLIAQSNPMAVPNFAEADEIAELIAYLATFQGSYLLGQMIYIDGGTDALMRPAAY